MESTAKLFMNGRSQAVRLPKEFRMKGTEVKIRKEGQKIILEPLARTQWPKGFWDFFSPDPDFEVPEDNGFSEKIEPSFPVTRLSYRVKQFVVVLTVCLEI